MSTTQTLLARRYTHPLVEGRTVVRLVPDSLRDVEDVSMRHFGFAPNGEAAVGETTPRAIGFPAWPIIHDPANAHHAVNLVADLHRARDLARSKPGAGRELLIECAEGLLRSAPHFVPTFLEEGARVFLRAENPRTAAQLFNRARDAERAHALHIDEQRHQAVFLEFALAGALSVKELQTEAKRLATALEPDDALATFLRLNVDRVRGGLPPYAQLAKDLGRLAKAAGITASEVERRFLADVIDAPALARAPLPFWRSIERTLGPLLCEEPAAVATLMHVTVDAIEPDEWAEFLVTTTIADRFGTGEVDDAAWVTRMVRSLSGRWDHAPTSKLNDLIRRCGRMEGHVIHVESVGSLEPALLDAVASLGGTVRPVYPLVSPRVDRWIDDVDRPSLTHLLDHPEMGPAFLARLDTVLYDGDDVAALAASDAGRDVLARWMARIDLPERPTITEAFSAHIPLGHVAQPACAGLWARASEWVTNLDAASLAAYELAAGTPIELHWPALEAAVEDLRARHDEALTFHEAWPAIGAHAGGEVVFLQGPDEVARHTFMDGNGVFDEDVAATLVDGVVGMEYISTMHVVTMAWSNGETCPEPLPYHSKGPRVLTVTFPVREGRITAGGLQRVGAEGPFSAGGRVLSDGDGFWSTAEGCVELDPSSGRAGRPSVPGPMADAVESARRDGWALRPERSFLMPEVEGSPLEAESGVHCSVALQRGRQWRYLDGQGREYVGYDTSREPVGVLGRVRRPGGGTWLLRADGGLTDADGSELLDAFTTDGTRHWWCEVPALAWHHATPRDEAVSARLRGLTAEDLGPLAEATPVPVNYPGWEREDPEFVTDELRALAADLLGTQDRTFVDAVIWVVASARWVVAKLRELADAAAKPVDEVTPASHDLFSWTNKDYADHRAMTIEDARAVDAAMRSGERCRAWITRQGFPALVLPEVVIGLAAVAGPEADVEGAVRAVEIAMDSGLHGPATTILRLELSPSESDERDAGEVDDSALLLGEESMTETQQVAWWALSRADEPPVTLFGKPTTTVLRAADIGHDALRAAIASLREGQRPDLGDAAERLAAGTGFTVAHCRYLLAGLPGLRTYVHRFLTKEYRTSIGLKEAEAVSAREFSQDRDVVEILELLAAGARDPERVVQDGWDVDAMVAWWQDKHAVAPELTLDDAVLAEVERAVGSYSAKELRAIVTGEETEHLYWSMVHMLGLWAIWHLDRQDPLRPAIAERWRHNAMRAFDAETTTGTWRAEFLTAFAAGSCDPLLDELRTPGEGSSSDPLVSAPGVVAACAEALELPEDAARYFLQLLGLPDPTDKLIQRWNGWTARQRKAAAAPLVERGLVIEAKRTRAGRTVFLPGGWLPASAPHLPLEVWKAPFLNLEDADEVDPAVFTIVAPTAPPAEHFAAVWERYADGDVPGYEELRTEPYRRSRG